MQSVYKRARFSEFINVTLDVAFQILTEVEVRDALQLNIAVANDERFGAFRQVMQADAIWRFWMMRDLSIIVKAFGSLQKLEFSAEDRPHWKTRYLWYRLFVSALQWSIVNTPQFVYIFENDVEYSYEYLNVVRVNGELVDFESLFVRFLDIVLVDEQRRGYDLFFFRADLIGPIRYESFFETYLRVPIVAARTYEDILKRFDSISDFKPGPNEPVLKDISDFVYSYLDEIRTFPRELQEKRIYVTAQCPSCGKVYSIKNT